MTNHYALVRYRTLQGVPYLGVGYVWEDGSISSRPVRLIVGDHLEDAVGELEQIISDIKEHPIVETPDNAQHG